jgi:hypothetical protein
MGLIAFLLVAAEKDNAEKVELGRGGVMRTILALMGLSALLFCTGCTHTSAVSTCRADPQRFVDENESYDAEYDSQFGATTVGQLSTRELLDRDEELIQCIGTDRRHEKLIEPCSIAMALLRGTDSSSTCWIRSNCRALSRGRKTSRQRSWRATEKGKLKRLFERLQGGLSGKRQSRLPTRRVGAQRNRAWLASIASPLRLQ